MFREYNSIEASDLPSEIGGYYDNKEGPPRQVELDENFFQNLESAAAYWSNSDQKFYKAQLEQVRRYALEDAERLLNMLAPRPDESRMKILERGHQGLKSIVNLGLRLKDVGVKVPWLNPQWEELINQARRGEINEPDQISPFRTREDEQTLELIARHDALQTALGARPGSGLKPQRKLTREQAESVAHIRAEFKQLSLQDQGEFRRLISDDDFYHQSLEHLKLRQVSHFGRDQNKLAA